MSQPSKPANPWIAYCNPRPDARLRLFCFPYAGGGASVYRTWAKDLPAAVDVCPVQYPGRETRMREPAITSLAEMVDAAATGLGPLLDRPYCFFGHSMGALVAFELARKLNRSSGATPTHLIVSGHRPPQLPYTSSLRHDLPRDEFIRQLRQLEGTPKEALESPELMEFILPIVRADCRICDLHVHTDATPVPFPLTAFGGVEDAEAGEDPLGQWRELAGGPFTLKMFPGGHFFLQSARTELLAALRAIVEPLATR